MIDESRGGLDLRGVTLVCHADIVDAPASLELNRRVHLKYVTEHGLELEHVRRYLATDDVTLRLQPVKTSSWDLRNADLPARCSRVANSIACGRVGESGVARPRGRM
jgi:hypothetical protein